MKAAVVPAVSSHGKLKMFPNRNPALAEAVKAYQRVAEGKARFRAVLTM